MRRREFIAGLGGVAALVPRALRAQDRVPRIGVLMARAENDPDGHAWMAAFREEIQKLGWAEGRNVRIDIRWTNAGDAGSMQRSAKELVALQPDLILSAATPTTASLLQLTRTIPIVFATASDPVGSGFVASFPRPGGSVTGFTNIDPATGGKWVELLKEIAPRVERAALLFNPTTAPYTEHYMVPFRAAAASFAVEPMAASVRDRSELDSVIGMAARGPNGALVVMTDTFTSIHSAEITSLAARHRLPAIYPYRFFVEAGGLLSYGNDLADNWRRAATYVDRILKGAKPAELPVQAPVKFVLTINLRTAKTLGLDVPTHLPAACRRGDRIGSVMSAVSTSPT